MRGKPLDGQLSLFPDKRQTKKQQRKRGKPSWDDVQEGSAVVVHSGSYSQPCTPECMWTENIGNYGGVSNCCYLFRKSIINGRCPASCSLEWTE